MKEFKALQSVLNTLGIKVMDDRMDKAYEAKFYCIALWVGSVDLQGEYSNYIASRITKAYPNATSILDADTGYVKIRFEYDDVVFNVCLT
jgi:hypothetical protein